MILLLLASREKQDFDEYINQRDCEKKSSKENLQ